MSVFKFKTDLVHNGEEQYTEYGKPTVNYIIYEIPKKVLSLVPLFKSMRIEDTPVYIGPITVEDDCVVDRVYVINTAEMFDIVMEYIDIWKDKPTADNYVKPPIHTKAITDILQKKDLDLILKYLKRTEARDVVPITDKLYQISKLNKLLKMVDGFLQMEGFANKIYAYIASLIINTSLMDIEFLMSDIAC